MFANWFPNGALDRHTRDNASASSPSARTSGASKSADRKRLVKSRKPSFESLDERMVLSASHLGCLPDSPDSETPAALRSDQQPAAQAADMSGDPLAASVVLAAAPQGTSTTVRMSGNTFIFTPANFGYSDPNDSPPQQFTAVKLTTVPAQGQMMFRGAGAVRGQFISFADLQSGQLSFRTSGVESRSYASFTFQVQDSTGSIDPAPKTFTLVFDNGRVNFVRGLYSDLLGRQPDTGGLINWLDQLDNGQSNLSVATALWTTAEHRGIQVDGYYQQFLGRNADAGGRQNWVNQMLGGMTEENVMVAFMTTTEYQNNNPSNTAFVTAVYRDLLNRTPDSGGLTTWVNALNNGQSRAQVAQSLVDTNERHQNLVTSYYLTYLRRFPDSNGFAFWTNQLNQGLFNDQGVALALLNTLEYVNLQH
jgi:hypothetical protein